MLTRFLGDTPLRVAIKLLILSLLVGLGMNAIGFTPRDIWLWIGDLVRGVWNLGFDAVLNSLEYLILGAAVVVPLFLIIRLLNFRSGRRDRD